MKQQKKTRKGSTQSRARPPLSRELVVKAALALVDQGGVEALSMRTVAAKLGVEAMSLYRHVAGKDDLLLGVADLVLSEIQVPPPGTPWRDAMRLRASSAREVFLRHPSGALLLESCATLSASKLRYADAILGLLMAGGFDATGACRAFLLLDSYLYGFTMQELSWPRPKARGPAPSFTEVSIEEFPHLATVTGLVKAKAGAEGLVQWYTEEFSVGLERVLDALERDRVTPAERLAPPARRPRPSATKRRR